jgi:hypothetical protein
LSPGPEKENTGSAGVPSTGWKRNAAMVAGGAVLLFVVVFLGLWQFGFRASDAIDVVTSHRVPGTDSTVGESILDFIEGKGIEVALEGFKPSWGAEPMDDDLWLVSFVYEVGREAEWLSWEVDARTREVLPRDEFALELWEGGRRN